MSMSSTLRLLRSSTVKRLARYGSIGNNCNSNSLVQSLRWFSSYPPHQLVGLPSLSPTMESGSIASWNKQEGDSFGAGDVICSVETDKATVDFEAQDDGIVAKILVPAGSAEIAVGQPIMVTVEDAGSVPAFADFQAGSLAASATKPPEPAVEPPTTTAAAPPPSSTAPATTTTTTAPASSTGGRIAASPLARVMAKEFGYDISSIQGTGPGGRVVAADVKEYQPSAVAAEAATFCPAAAVRAPAQEAIAAAASTSAAPPVVGVGYTDYPLSEHAKQVAAQLLHAKRNVPHYYLTVDISVDKLLELRKTLNASGENNIGVYELLIKAAATSMKSVPSVNASWMEEVVRVYDQVNINVVVGSGDTLATPVLENCSAKGVRAISDELQSAMEAETASSALGTFTILNLGMYGVKSCAPIIREPQACALAVGALENRIVPADDPDELYKESVMFTATLSCDHRVVDGAVGAQWLAAFKSHIENPMTLLL